MNEKLILEKLESLSQEIADLKKEVGKMRASSSISSSRPAHPFPKNTSHYREELHRESGEILYPPEGENLTLKGNVNITEKIVPDAAQFFKECDGQYDEEELKAFISKMLNSLQTMNAAMDILKSTIELRDDLVPVAKLSYPKVQKFLNALHEGEFQAEQLGTLLHTFLLNIHTFSDLMNMISPMTEFFKESKVVIQQTDVLVNINKWLDSLQQGNGAVKFLAMTMAAFKKINLTNKQFDEICESLSSIDFTKVQPIGPVAMMKQLRDPQFQQALGAIVMMIQALGGCVTACRSNGEESTIE